VDFTVRVQGSVRVGEDYSRDATTSIPWIEVTTMLREGFSVTDQQMIAKMDRGEAVTRQDLVEVMENGPLALEYAINLVRKALERDESGVGKVREKVELEEAAKRLLSETCKRLPPQECQGKVTMEVNVSPVTVGTPAEVAAAVARV
jgi:hypothetical protein